MERVMVVGCAGAGKSTFARALAERTGLPLVHLDRHYWRAGWVEPQRDAWRAQVAVLAGAGRWIIDGNYGDTLDLRLVRADTIVFLDLPRYRCLMGVLVRALRGWGQTRDDMAPGCPERIDVKFLRYVWNYRRSHRSRVLATLDAFRGARVVLRSRREAGNYLRALPPVAVRAGGIQPEPASFL